MKDLTKILKVGDEVYCTLTGGYMKITDINSSLNGFPIKAEYGTRILYLTKAGHFYYDFPDAEPVIYPSKENRDWEDIKQRMIAKMKADLEKLEKS